MLESPAIRRPRSSIEEGKRERRQRGSRGYAHRARGQAVVTRNGQLTASRLGSWRSASSCSGPVPRAGRIGEARDVVKLLGSSISHGDECGRRIGIGRQRPAAVLGSVFTGWSSSGGDWARRQAGKAWLGVAEFVVASAWPGAAPRLQFEDDGRRRGVSRWRSKKAFS